MFYLDIKNKNMHVYESHQIKLKEKKKHYEWFRKKNA